MDVVEVGRTAGRDVPMYAGTNEIVPIDRINPHTDFSGDVESGLSKMLLIRMGKQRGAKMARI